MIRFLPIHPYSLYESLAVLCDGKVSSLCPNNPFEYTKMKKQDNL